MIRKINNKKASHVEMVISFALFVTFLVFMYSVLEPAVKKPKSKEYILESAKSAILDYIQEEVLVYSLEINNDEPGASEGSCFSISDNRMNLNATVKNSNQGIANSILTKEYNSEGGYYYDKLSIIYYSDKYTIYLSKEFPLGTYTECVGSLTGCDSASVDERCFNLNKIRTEKHIFQSKIEKMKEKYDGDSSEVYLLRREIGITDEGTNFYFKLIDLERGDVIAPKKPTIQDNVNVYVEEFPIDYIDDENDPENKQGGFLIIEVW